MTKREIKNNFHDEKFYKKPMDLKGKSSTFFGDMLNVVSVLTVATVLSTLFEKWNQQADNSLMVYMVGGLVAAMLVKLLVSSVIYATASILIFNFIFTEPKMTFHVNDTRYFTTFGVMFIITITVSALVQRMRWIARNSEARAYRTEILLETSQKLQQAEGASKIAEATICQIEKLSGCTVYCILGKPKPDMGQEEYYVSHKNAPPLTKDEQAVAVWVYNNNHYAGRTTTTLPGARCLYLTVRNGKKIFAIVGVDLEEKTLNAFEKSVMLAMLNESALAFVKEELRRKEHETALRLEQESLRANLLRAVSHDLRTPLTSISGNADVLIQCYQMMSDGERKQMFQDIYEDSSWLISLVENLLAVTRIENGTMKIHLQPEMVVDVFDACEKHLKRHLGNHKLTVDPPDEFLMAKMDTKLIIQVITNLVDNAVKHTPDGCEIWLRAYEDKKKVIFEVADNGPGILDSQKEKIFDMFYSGSENVSADSKRCMGIGLSLCKSIIEAHGGRLTVEDNHPKGAVFRFELETEEVNI